nr:hypothetical protein [uncultured Desulfuromonas sp.]
MIYFNIIITLLCLWIGLWLNHYYLRPAKVNKNRFELFALRDQLAIMAMKKQISEEDKDYKLMLKLLNTSIKAMDDFSILRYLKVMYVLTTQQKVQDEIEHMVKNLKEHKNPELSIIAKKYFYVSRKAFIANTKFLRTTIIPLLSLFILFLSLISKTIDSRWPERIFTKLTVKRENYYAIDSNLEDRIKDLQFATI